MGGEKMFPWILCGILSLICICLLVKVVLMKKSIHELCRDFREHLSTDTNTLISVSVGDPHIRKLAAEINVQLTQLRKERQRFQHGDSELKQAVTNISHDLRTPLTAICGYLDLLEKEEQSKEVHEYLCQIKERTEAMKALTEELFRYSVIRSQEEFKPEKLDLSRALEENLLSFYGVMQERKIVPQLDLPEEPVWRELDKVALNRILSNIINNAVKYSDGDFAVRLTSAGEMTFANSAKNLTPVEVSKMFDRFYTVDSARSSTGLGLSIAKILTEKCHGQISAECISGVLTIHLKL